MPLTLTFVLDPSGQMSAREGDQDSTLELPATRSLTSLQKASTQDLTGTGEELRTPPPEESSTPRAPASDGEW